MAAMDIETVSLMHEPVPGPKLRSKFHKTALATGLVAIVTCVAFTLQKQFHFQASKASLGANMAMYAKGTTCGWTPKGLGTCCHQDAWDKTIDARGTAQVLSNITRDECAELCKESDCIAFEFNTEGRCELHPENIGDFTCVDGVENKSTFECVFKEHCSVKSLSELKNGVQLWEANKAYALNQHGHISKWDIRVESLQDAFEALTNFNEDISKWNITGVKNMQNTFSGALHFNQDVGSWDTSAVTSMMGTFQFTFDFNGDIGGWDTSAVTSMFMMFFMSGSFNRDIGSWDTSAVTDMNGMFHAANAFNQDLGNWDTSAVKTMAEMFTGAKRFNGDLAGWDTSAVTTMESMFADAYEFNGNIGSWDTSAVTSFQWMFATAKAFNQDISGWDVSAAESMNGMFTRASSFNQDIRDWDTSKVKDMESMFSDADSFDQDISDWDVSKVTSFKNMFLEWSAPPVMALSDCNKHKIYHSWGQQNELFKTEYPWWAHLSC